MDKATKAYAKQYTAINRKLEQKWFPKVLKSVNSKISSLIEKVKEDGVDAGFRYLRLDLGNTKLAGVIEDMYKSVGLVHAERAERRLRKLAGKKAMPLRLETKRFGQSESWVQFIVNYLNQFLLEKITFRVNEATRNALLKVLEDAVTNGWGVDEIVKRLENLPFARYQAARIVRTEINRAANVGVKSQGSEFEYELMKEWISVRDSRTRGVDANDHADHYHLNGVRVDFYAMFIDPRNGHELDHPGDPKAEAEDVINCRCNMATIPKRDENGRLIPKKKTATVILPRNNTARQTIAI